MSEPQKQKPVESLDERLERRRNALAYNAAFISKWPWMLATPAALFGFFWLVDAVLPKGTLKNIIALATIIPSAISLICFWFAITSTPEKPNAKALKEGWLKEVPDDPGLIAVHGSARWATLDELRARNMLVDAADIVERAKRIILGTADNGMLVAHAALTGIITVGAPGTGKFLTSIALNLFNWLLGSVWVFDPKGEITIVTAAFRAAFSKVYVIDPFGVTARYPWIKRARFNPLDAIADAADFDDAAATLAARLVANEDGKDDFWLQGARALMAGILAYLFHGRSCVDEDGVVYPRTLAGVQAFLQQPPEVLTAHARMVMADKRDAMHLARDGMVEWASAIAANSKPGQTASGHDWPKSTLETLFTLRRQLGELLRSSGIRETLSGSDFKWSDLRREKCSVYVVLPADKVERFERFTTLLLDDAL